MSLLTSILSSTGGSSGSVQGVILAPAICASTANLTVTQAGAGPGATLTNAGAQAAFTVDGITPAVGSRILIKNQSTASQNGVYTLTNAGSVSTNWVLTRATDFNQASQISVGVEIVVVSGTVNAGSDWIQSATVSTVDTDSITFISSAIAGLSPGVVLQVVQGTLTTTASSASLTFADTGLTATITPSKNTNKVLIIASVSTGADPASNGPTFLRLSGGNSGTFIGTTAGSRTSIACQGGSEVAGGTLTGSIVYLDSPATTSATTYKVQFAASNGAATVYVNRTSTDGNTSNVPRPASSIVLLEISA